MTRAITTGQETTALILALFLVQFIAASAAVARDLVFTARDIAGWETERFKGPVEYRLVQQDGREALHAVCSGKGASARYLRREIDLRETPVVEWSWRIQGTFSGPDERTKAGDDYPVRVYAVVDGLSAGMAYPGGELRLGKRAAGGERLAQCLRLPGQDAGLTIGLGAGRRMDHGAAGPGVGLPAPPRGEPRGHPWPGDHDRL